MRLSRKFYSSRTVFNKAAEKWTPMCVSYQDLLKPEKQSHLVEKIEKAYSKQKGGLGAIMISDIPGFQQMNENLAKWGYKLNNDLSREEKQKLERPDVSSAIGYSRGSYTTGDSLDTEVSHFVTIPLLEQFPVFDLHEKKENTWPESMPQLKTDVKAGAVVLQEAAMALARHMDYYLDQKLPGKKERMVDMVKMEHSNMNRLGYCFPVNVETETILFSWHQDYDLVTCLGPNVFFDEQGEIVPWDDDNSGLFVMNSQTYEVQKFPIPPDCLCIQAGEFIQILTGGEIMATPHAVVAPKKQPNLSRFSLVQFLYPANETVMDVPEGKRMEDAFPTEGFPLHDHHHLRHRWRKGQTSIELLKTSSLNFYQ